MQTADKILQLGDESYIYAQSLRKQAAELLHEAEQRELKAITLWADNLKDPSPCSSTDSSASPSD
jgi:hypothetical protein